ncbi:MAG: hypothetical protein SGJ18_04040 [Pseudomonadota bacterium]|nr:hypothetical protein [Pseudomonadota bacterium]
MNSLVKKQVYIPSVLVKDLPADEVIKIITVSQVGHVVQKNGVDFELEKQFVDGVKLNSLNYFSDPLKAILGSTLINQLHIKFKESVQKKETIEKVKVWVSNIRGASRIQDSIYLIVDELFTNAIYNALPFFVGLRDSLDRKEKVDLTDRKACEIFVGHNEHRLILGCSDSFGSLNLEKLSNQLLNTYAKGIAGSIKYGKNGAGIGCRLMFDNCINFYLGVRENEQTIVALGLPIGPNARAIDINFKNIHFIINKE